VVDAVQRGFYKYLTAPEDIPYFLFVMHFGYCVNSKGFPFDDGGP